MTKIKFFSIATIVTVLIAGCASSESTYTSTGKKGHSIDCSSSIGTWGDCYEEAGEICGARGYTILEKIGDKESSTYADKDGLVSNSSNTRSMIIQCK